MRAKLPWTGSRIAAVAIAVFFLLVTFFGLYWFIGGTSLIHHANTTNEPEDWSGIGGFFFQLAGLGLMIIGGALTLLFTGLYISTTRRLRHSQANVPRPNIVRPEVVKNIK